MRLSFTYGCYIFIDAVIINNIYSIDIDENEKQMELNGIDGFVIATIPNYEEVKEAGFVKFTINDSLEPDDYKLIINGEIAIGDNNE